jgi:hypothetical protein
MRFIAAKYAIRDFQLTHDMFTVDKRRVAAFCEAMLASGENFTWSCSARTDCVDENLLDLMARAGCRGIFFGIETGSQRMQNIIDKHLDVRRAETVIDIAESLGIGTTIALITGFPEETWDDVRQTIRVYMHSARHPRSDPQLNLLAPLAGTPVYSRHQEELVLEELCSDMSHQGSAQNAADLALIRNHVEIFPNFYLLPVPDLDRNILFELHEFSQMAVVSFRWLLSAIDQHAIEAFDFFLQWRAHRLLIRCGQKHSELRHYYRTHQCRSDFLSYVRTHPAASHPSISALVQYEDAIARSAPPHFNNRAFHLVDQEPSHTDIPILTSNTRVIEISYDIQRVIDGLKSGADPNVQPGTYFYATRETAAGKCRLMGISDWMYYLLRACDGLRTMKDVLAQLCADVPEIKEPSRDYAFLRLLQGAQAAGFVTIYRNAQIEECSSPLAEALTNQC